MRAILLTAALASASAYAQELTIKDFAMGGDLRAEAARGGLECSAREFRGIKSESCTPRFGTQRPDLTRTIAGMPADFFMLSGFDNKLGSIYATFKASGFSTVQAALQEKYPTLKCETSTVKNRMGASFDQTECVISTDAAVLVLTQRGSDLNTSSISVKSAEYSKRFEEERKKAVGEAKKDI